MIILYGITDFSGGSIKSNKMILATIIDIFQFLNTTYIPRNEFCIYAACTY